MCNCKIRTSTLTSCQFRARKVISEKNNPAKQAHKIWRKNFKGLLSYHILGVGSLFLAAPCIVQFHEGVCKNWACRERRSAVYLCFDGEGFVHWCTLDDPKEKMKRRIWTKLPFEFFYAILLVLVPYAVIHYDEKILTCAQKFPGKFTAMNPTENQRMKELDKESRSSYWICDQQSMQ